MHDALLVRVVQGARGVAHELDEQAALAAVDRVDRAAVDQLQAM